MKSSFLFVLTLLLSTSVWAEPPHYSITSLEKGCKEGQVANLAWSGIERQEVCITPVDCKGTPTIYGPLQNSGVDCKYYDSAPATYRCESGNVEIICPTIHL